MACDSPRFHILPPQSSMDWLYCCNSPKISRLKQGTSLGFINTQEIPSSESNLVSNCVYSMSSGLFSSDNISNWHASFLVHVPSFPISSSPFELVFLR